MLREETHKKVVFVSGRSTYFYLLDDVELCVDGGVELVGAQPYQQC